MNRTLLVNSTVAVSAAVIGSLATLFLTGQLFSSTVSRDCVGAGESIADEAVRQCEVSNLDSPDPLDKDYSISAQTDNVRQLQAALEEAAAERAQLADSVAQLNRQVIALESDIINQNSLLAQYESLDSTGNPTLDADGSASAPESGRGTDTKVQFNSLLAAGVDQQIATSIQARQDQFQLQRLELFDLAEREGWIDTDQFSDRLEELEDQRVDVRAELGDAAYDQYLYELGRSNRVIVSSVINGSAAQIAGLQNGDVILAYASERVFSTRDLQAATRSGLRGESVSVNFEREGQNIITEIPRGPLGVTLTMTTREPI